MTGRTYIIQKKEKNKIETGNNNIVKTMKIIMKDRILLGVNYKTHSIDHNSNQGTLTMTQDIFITTKKVKTHTHDLEMIMNS